MSGRFLWGASSAPHQIEGNNVNSDWWAREAEMPGMAPSGDALDSYHRYREDMELLAGAGANAYRFGIEWARIEPREGRFSRAELAHYRRMIDTAVELGLEPIVTLQHFTVPRWFADRGSWLADDAVDVFRRYVEEATSILSGVGWVITINEPNILALMTPLLTRTPDADASPDWQSPTVASDTAPDAEPDAVPDAAPEQFILPPPGAELAARLIEAHHAARAVIRSRTDARVGWSIANQAFEAAPGGEERLAQESWSREDVFLVAAQGDDFVGVQSYSSQRVDANGLVPHPPSSDNTLVGTPFRPDALGMAIRHTWEVTGGVPILVTENGIATADDSRRIEYTRLALEGMRAAMADGIPVLGYCHWSLLDNYEWGHWEPTFGLIAVDRETFVRTPKPSLAWFGSVARAGDPVVTSP